MNTNLVSWRLEQAIGYITLEHPPANALSQEVFAALDAALDQAEQASECKVIILSGAGRFFAAGADIREFIGINAEQGEQIAKTGHRVFARMVAFTKPIIAAIHGAALGGGLELAMACHLRLATPEAKLGLPELNLGLIPGFAGTQRLQQLVGLPKAMELLLTSDPINGEEAKALGLVNHTVPDTELLDFAQKLAERIAAKGGVSIRYAMEAMQKGFTEGFEAGAAKEVELFGQIFESHDAKEGVAAFMEKRKPNFTNQ